MHAAPSSKVQGTELSLNEGKDETIMPRVSYVKDISIVKTEPRSAMELSLRDTLALDPSKLEA